MQPMQQDLLTNGNYAQYLAHALTPPVPGAGGMIGGYGGQGIGAQGFGQLGQGLPGQVNSGTVPGGVATQPGYGYQGLQPGFGQPFGAQQHIAVQQQHIAATLHQLAHQAASQAVLDQQIASVLNQLAHQCAWQAQSISQNRYAGFGPQTVYGYGGPANVMPFGQMPFAQAGGFNRPLW